MESRNRMRTDRGRRVVHANSRRAICPPKPSFIALTKDWQVFEPEVNLMMGQVSVPETPLTNNL